MMTRVHGLITVVSATLGPCCANELEVTVQTETEANILFVMWPVDSAPNKEGLMASLFNDSSAAGMFEASDTRAYLDLTTKPYFQDQPFGRRAHLFRSNAWRANDKAIHVFLPPNARFILRPVIGQWRWTCSVSDWWFWSRMCHWRETAIIYKMPLACLNRRGAKMWKDFTAAEDGSSRNSELSPPGRDLVDASKAFAYIEKQGGVTFLENLVAPPVCVAHVQYFGYAIPIPCPSDVVVNHSRPVTVPASCVSISEVIAP